MSGLFPSVHRRGFQWLPTYFRERATRRCPKPGQPVHLLLCIADHFEPGNGGVSAKLADDRVEKWVSQYPLLFSRFKDCDGKPPRHTFFYPLEMYRAAELDRLSDLCRSGFGEVEVHLHHDRDTAENLRQSLTNFKNLLRDRHGMLGYHCQTGESGYAFVHGDWALDNSRPDGRCCGVNNELDILRQTGCYADFTLPSFPSQTQTRKINSIYHAVDDPVKPKSHDWGTNLGHATAPKDSLMMFQGPLLLNWRSRKTGIIPRIENATIQGNQPPTAGRLDLWLKASIQVPARPDWYFVKLHTHGATEGNQKVLLGQPMVDFHLALQSRADSDPLFHFHYVTAREMYNLAKAAEAGWTGSVKDVRDFEFLPPRLNGGGISGESSGTGNISEPDGCASGAPAGKNQ